MWLHTKPMMRVFHRAVEGRGMVSNSCRARWGWPSWQSLLRRERTVGVLRVGGGIDAAAAAAVCGGRGSGGRAEEAAIVGFTAECQDRLSLSVVVGEVK